MNLSVKTTVRALMAAGILLSSVSLAVAAPNMSRNVAQPSQRHRVHTDATGVSGFAVVDSDGTLARKLNAKSVSHTPGTNDYIVEFNSNVRGCAYTATIGLTGSSGVAQPAIATVVSAAASVKSVFVSTYTAAGSDSEQPFHLVVTC